MSDCLAVVSGPCAPIPTPGYSNGSAPSASSNNVSVPAVQSQDVTALLTVPLNAFTVVKVVSGGVAPVDPNVAADHDAVLGITLQAGTTGQGVLVRPLGLIVNPLTGTLAWNWALGDTIYVGAGGVLNNAPNATGWNLIVGHAFAPAGILFKPETDAPADPSIREVTAAGTTALTTSDEIILADATAGNQTLQLPLAPAFNQRVAVKRLDGSANAITLDGNGHNIDGAATLALTGQYASHRLTYSRSNGAWYLEV